MTKYVVTGQYRQDIDATVDADSEEDAVRQANSLFMKWMETMTEDVAGISFGPPEATLDDDVLVSQARAPTPDNRSCWTAAVVMSLYETVDAAAKRPSS